MTEERKDGSRRFKLNGGPLNGVTVRLYPNNPREVRAGKTGEYDLHYITACGTTVHYDHNQPSAKTLEFKEEYI